MASCSMCTVNRPLESSSRVWSVGRPNVPQAKGGYDGVNMGNPPPPEGLRVWPRPVTTDDQGRFTVTGIGRDVTVGFHVRDRRFASGGFQVRTDDRDGPKTVTEALRPAMIIEGRVLAADTGQPIPQALVEVGLGMVILPGGRVVSGGGGDRHRADNQGHFTANVQPGTNYRVRAIPPEGQPYLNAQVEFEWTKGAVRKEIDVKVPRGVVIHGKVVEAGTGRALPGASVQYIPMGNRGNGAMASGSDTTVVSKKDGTYQITVRPGKGHLFVFGPTSDYILEAIGGRTIYNGQPGGVRHYAHGIIPYEVKAGDPPHEITAVLRPGKTIKGRVVGPNDETVEHAMIISTLNIEHFQPHLARRYHAPRPRWPLRAARGRPGEAHSRLLPRRRPPVGRDGRDLRQASRRGRAGSPPALRPGQGAGRRARRQACGESVPSVRDPGNARTA